ncbi:MAG: response regulator [Deltaproteobacteria bacterium]|nr:response regulator [Deltaproteobacteria bacterium]
MNGTILIVDDNLDNVNLLKKVLDKAGYHTICGYNGEEAVRLARENFPDLILLDIMMPVMDGFEACAIIRSDEITRDIPILMLTAKQEISDKVRGLEIGADDYITKPFHLQELLARIRSRLKLTENHQRKVDQEKHRALSRMVQGVEHEIRNPVVSIGGFARRMLEEMPDDDRKKAYARIILKETERLEQMVKESAALQKLAEGNEECVDIHLLLDEALSQCKVLGEQQQATVTTDYDSNLPPLMLHRGNMLIAFVQLIGNAFEALNKNGKLTVKTLRDEQAGKLLIRIIDDGRGISREDLKHIFDPFFTSKMSGSGMGLPMAKKIIEEHHGTIAITSRPGEGTCVTIGLPLPAKEAAVPA